jgi:ribosome maturation factor RimP
VNEELKQLVGKRVKVVCLYPNSQLIFYTGIIQEVRDNTLVLLDKFNNIVLINIDVIKEVSTLGDWRRYDEC